MLWKFLYNKYINTRYMMMLLASFMIFLQQKSSKCNILQACIKYLEAKSFCNLVVPFNFPIHFNHSRSRQKEFFFDRFHFFDQTFCTLRVCATLQNLKTWTIVQIKIIILFLFPLLLIMRNHLGCFIHQFRIALLFSR